MVAAGISPLIGGVQAITFLTPATLAVRIVMWAARQGIAPAGHVSADSVDGNVSLTEVHAGHRLHLELDRQFELALGEVANVPLSGFDVVEHVARDR